MTLNPQTIVCCNILQVAERLYTQGFVSYPRTETDQFDRNMDLRALVDKQTVSNDWGAFATGYVFAPTS